MIRLLSNRDMDRAREYLQRDPEYNIFMIGDLENYTLEHEYVSAAVNETENGWDFFVLRYLDNFVLYSDREDYDAKLAAEYICAQDCDAVSGKGSVLHKLAPYFERAPRVMYLSRCDSATEFPLKAEGIRVRRLTPDDAGRIVELYSQVEEFRDEYLGREEELEEKERIGLTTGGTSFGAFHGGKLVCCASTTAENSQSAMIIGVATHPDYQKRGLASAVVSGLCRDCLGRGMKFLCLFYDNPKAGSIYRKIGFEEMGEYIVIRGNGEDSE